MKKIRRDGVMTYVESSRVTKVLVNGWVLVYEAPGGRLVLKTSPNGEVSDSRDKGRVFEMTRSNVIDEAWVKRVTYRD